MEWQALSIYFMKNDICEKLDTLLLFLYLECEISKSRVSA